MSTFVTENNKNAHSGEIDWDRLNKTKFFFIGTGLFSGVSTLLYPFSVIKTRLQVSNANSPSNTTLKTIQNIAKTDGILGFYRGFGTVIAGTIPSRVVYLSILELTKASILNVSHTYGLSEAFSAGIASGAGGLCGSLAVQSILVPVDVISSRLMAQGEQSKHLHRYKGGFDAFKVILKSEGVKGLYRGFGMSIITYVPSSGIWWATYGSSQRLMWKYFGGADNFHSSHEDNNNNNNNIVDNDKNNDYSHSNDAIHGIGDSKNEFKNTKAVIFQALGGTCAGLTAAIVTTPLDTIKTRIQVMQKSGENVPILQVARNLVKEKGWRGFYVGLLPRCLSMSLWGTCMITTYEFLKRLAANESSPV